MRVHLVGGFLGSGKTTAIASAAGLLLERGIKPGVVTNDQGQIQVDQAFLGRTAPAVSVGGGCFCCRYDDLDARLAELDSAHHPELVFCESVGSCADLVATVLRPLLELRHAAVTGLTVFVDGRLLWRRRTGRPLPFNDDVIYIFDKQLEEASQVLVNKADLLSPAQRDELAAAMSPNWQLVSMLDPQQVASWLTSIESPLPLTAPLEIDYERYADGELLLAWLDAELPLPPDTAPSEVAAALDRAVDGVAVGHLKLAFEGSCGTVKLSRTAADDHLIGRAPGHAERVKINIRAQLPAHELESRVSQALAHLGVEGHLTCFHPGKPMPTHRIGASTQAVR